MTYSELHNNGRYQIYSQVNRYITPLSSNTVIGGYAEGSSMELPPSDYSYSDQGNFQDSDGQLSILRSFNLRDFSTISLLVPSCRKI